DPLAAMTSRKPDAETARTLSPGPCCVSFSRLCCGISVLPGRRTACFNRRKAQAMPEDIRVGSLELRFLYSKHDTAGGLDMCEMSAEVAANTPPDPAKMRAIMERHGLIPVARE